MTDSKTHNENHDQAMVEQLLDSNGIYWFLTVLAAAVRKQGKKRQKLSMVPRVSKQYVKLSEGIARNIEKARDAI